MKSKKIIVIDTDGVLVEYPKHFERYVYELLGKKYSLDKIKQLPQYKQLKYSYRVSGIKRTLPLFYKDIPKIIDQLRKKYEIWIITTRPIELSGMDTIAWLSANRIHYDELFFVVDKVEFIHTVKENVYAFIDDDFQNNLNPFIGIDMITIHIQKPLDWIGVFQKIYKNNRT